VTAELETKVTEDITLRAAYTYFNLNRDIEYAINFDLAFFGGPPVPPDFLGRAGGTDRASIEGHTLQTDLQIKTELFGMPHKILLGYDALFAERNGLVNVLALNPIDPAAPVYDPTLSPPALFDNYDSAFQSRQVGLFIQDEITVAQDLPGIHKLTLLLGGRQDFANEKLDTAGLIFFAPPANADLNNDAFSPRAAVLWMPTNWLSLYGSYSESFNPQDPEGISSFAEQNPEPTLAEQYEIGAKVQLLPNLVASIAAFDIEKTNVPVFEGFFNTPTDVASRGIEFELVGEIVKGWQIAGGYAYTETEVTSGPDIGNRLIGAAENVLGLFWGYTFQPGSGLAGFGFGGGINYVGDVFADTTSTISLPSYTLYDAALWYRPEKGRNPYQVEYQLNVKNLTDEEYLVGANGLFAVQDGTARTWLGSVRVKF
jgi:iron complex outermembrane recepter protein